MKYHYKDRFQLNLLENLANSRNLKNNESKQKWSNIYKFIKSIIQKFLESSKNGVI